MVSVDKYVILYKSLATLVFDNTNYNRNEGLKMGWIITLIVGAIIGIIASSITGKNFPAGMFGNIIAGLLGAWLGSRLFGSFGIIWWDSCRASIIRCNCVNSYCIICSKSCKKIKAITDCFIKPF